MSVWEYTGLFIILLMIYYNDKARELVKTNFKRALKIIERGGFD